MANLIDRSFFVAEISIPNSDNLAVAERIDWFITKYEKECLKLILGVKLYNLYLTDPTNQLIKDLIEGVSYEDAIGVPVNWHGLIHDTNMSLIANYVYYFIMQSSAIHTTGVSTSVSNTESGRSVWPVEKMCEGYNEFSREVRYQLIPFLLGKKTPTEEVAYKNYYSTKDAVHAISNTRPINTLGI